MDPTAKGLQKNSTAKGLQKDPTSKGLQKDPTAKGLQKDSTAKELQKDPTEEGRQKGVKFVFRIIFCNSFLSGCSDLKYDVILQVQYRQNYTYNGHIFIIRRTQYAPCTTTKFLCSQIKLIERVFPHQHRNM